MPCKLHPPQLTRCAVAGWHLIEFALPAAAFSATLFIATEFLNGIMPERFDLFESGWLTLLAIILAFLVAIEVHVLYADRLRRNVRRFVYRPLMPLLVDYIGRNGGISKLHCWNGDSPGVAALDCGRLVLCDRSTRFEVKTINRRNLRCCWLISAANPPTIMLEFTCDTSPFVREAQIDFADRRAATEWFHALSHVLGATDVNGRNVRLNPDSTAWIANCEDAGQW